MLFSIPALNIYMELLPYPGSPNEKEDQIITESQNGRGWKGPLWVI